MMSVYVVVVNRVLWRRLYALAENEVPAVSVATHRSDRRQRRAAKRFPQPGGQGRVHRARATSTSRVASGEVVALLGRSGSGKSTLLRIMAGLDPAVAGTVVSSGKPLHGANPDVAMVFQSFALLPWLTVLENVEMGLEARGVGRDRAHEARAQGDRPGRSRRLRERVSQGTFRRHETARRLRARARRSNPKCCSWTSRSARSTC